MSDLPIRASVRHPWRLWGPVFGLLFGLALALILPAVASADPGDIGFEGPAGPGGAPSGSKPESKLWFNDSSWWGKPVGHCQQPVRGDLPASAPGANGPPPMFRFDDPRNTRADTLWDGTKLYVASQNNSDGGALTGGTARLYRFSYNSSTDTYTLDGGFPATMRANIRSETLVIAKDSTGLLWATWTRTRAEPPRQDQPLDRGQ